MKNLIVFIFVPVILVMSCGDEFYNPVVNTNDTPTYTSTDTDIGTFFTVTTNYFYSYDHYTNIVTNVTEYNAGIKKEYIEKSSKNSSNISEQLFFVGRDYFHVNAWDGDPTNYSLDLLFGSNYNFNMNNYVTSDNSEVTSILRNDSNFNCFTLDVGETIANITTNMIITNNFYHITIRQRISYFNGVEDKDTIGYSVLYDNGSSNWYTFRSENGKEVTNFIKIAGNAYVTNIKPVLFLDDGDENNNIYYDMFVRFEWVNNHSVFLHNAYVYTQSYDIVKQTNFTTNHVTTTNVQVSVVTNYY